jgi:hypothetical protein
MTTSATTRHLDPKHVFFGFVGLAALFVLYNNERFIVDHSDRRNYQQHRQWMIRSYSIALIFLTDRVLDAIPGVAAFDTDADPSISWFCNVIAWVLPSFIISWQSMTNPSSAKVHFPEIQRA